MKTTLTIVLAFLILVQSFTRSFIYLNYEVNKDYISNVLCENKEDIEMHCEGKCHLKKELDKEEKNESTPAGSNKEKYEIILFNSIKPALTFLFIQASSEQHFFNETINYPLSLSAIFHPPCID